MTKRQVYHRHVKTCAWFCGLGLAAVLAGCQGGTAQPSATGTILPTLRYNIGSDPGSLDPAQDADTNETFVDLQLGSTLVVPDKNLKPTPGLAEKWQLSDDGRTYTFNLRPQLKWSDGSPLTASDLEYSLKRVLDPATAAPAANLLDLIAGAREFRSAKGAATEDLARLRDTVDVHATAPTTLVIRLTQPASYFLSVLFAGVTIPVKKESVEQYGPSAFDAGHMVGSGPFVLTGWTHKGALDLAPNPNFYGPAAKIKVHLAEINEPTATLAAYKNDEIDTTGGIQLGTADIAALRNDASYRGQAGDWSELGESWLQFNVAKKPFDNKLLRRAINLAINRRELVDKVMGGLAEPATTLVPPGMAGYLEPGEQGLGYDPQKARQLLAEAGFPNGQGLPQNVPMAYNNISILPAILQYVQANLAAVNISTQLEPRESSSYFSGLRQDAPALFRSGWNADYPDPDNWYTIFVTGATPNYGHWTNDEYDRLVRQAAVEPDTGKRLDQYKRASQILTDDPPLAFWYYPRRFKLVKPRVHGLETTAQDGGYPGKYTLREVTIS